jgi:hypothetical protein
MVCIIAKTNTQSFSKSDWAKASKYTDDTVANDALAKINEAKKDIALNA